jgi:glycosyltransferase involved in cell wall biosynthesis
MAELTVIIPFCNEGDEVLKTCESCLEFAMGPIEFILIDDNSVDGYNYISVAKRNNATLITHSKQLGVSPSRNDGVELCKTPYFLFLDAHMSQTRKG